MKTIHKSLVARVTYPSASQGEYVNFTTKRFLELPPGTRVLMAGTEMEIIATYHDKGLMVGSARVIREANRKPDTTVDGAPRDLLH